MWNKIFFAINFILYIAVSEFIAYVYFSIFQYFMPPMLSPGSFTAAQMYYYTVGAVIGVLAFILMTMYSAINRKLNMLTHKQAAEQKAETHKEEKK